MRRPTCVFYGRTRLGSALPRASPSAPPRQKLPAARARYRCTEICTSAPCPAFSGFLLRASASQRQKLPAARARHRCTEICASAPCPAFSGFLLRASASPRQKLPASRARHRCTEICASAPCPAFSVLPPPRLRVSASKAARHPCPGTDVLRSVPRRLAPRSPCFFLRASASPRQKLPASRAPALMYGDLRLGALPRVLRASPSAPPRLRVKSCPPPVPRY